MHCKKNRVSNKNKSAISISIQNLRILIYFLICENFELKRELILLFRMIRYNFIEISKFNTSQAVKSDFHYVIFSGWSSIETRFYFGSAEIIFFCNNWTIFIKAKYAFSSREGYIAYSKQSLNDVVQIWYIPSHPNRPLFSGGFRCFGMYHIKEIKNLHLVVMIFQ